MSGQSCAIFVPKRGYKQRPRQYAASLTPVRNPIDISQYSNLLDLRAGREHTTESTTTATEASSTSSVLIPMVEEDEGIPHEEQRNAISFLNPTHSSECSKKEKISYFVLFGYRLASRNVAATLKGIDQSSCVMYCSQNINANGDVVPCYSANYEPIEEKCYLYGKRSRSDRHTAHLAEDSNYIFADKFCVETKKDCSAETPYIVYPFKQMHKKIITSYPGMNSVVACVAACIDSKKCRAVTYKIGLCILHGASPATDSGLLVQGNEQTMVIENGCQLTASTLPALLSNMLVNRCFERITRRTIDNYPPLAEYQMETLRACADYCIMAAGNERKKEPLCRSFTYNIALKICHLYDHDGMKVPAILYPAIGIDFYKRIDKDEICRSTFPFKNNNANFAVIGSPTSAQENTNEEFESLGEIETFSSRIRNQDIPNEKAITIDGDLKVLQKKPTKEFGKISKNTKDVAESEQCFTSNAYYVVIGDEIVRPMNNEDSISRIQHDEEIHGKR
ncbi:hypothetical protein RB195_026164 [Necator americanus]|uniref:Apple domain-containing protein n=1 Tax=Necator americanus TaxID=51031 RepID=A0ABR1EVR0_NECAM